MKQEASYRTVLSLDGGGIRGLIPARILQEPESRTKRRISQIFDLIVGTSTGGILAAGLSRPPERGGPCAAEELVRIYSERGREIFSRSFWRGLTTIGGLADERYHAAPLYGILEEMLGSTELRETVPDIVLTSYDIERREPYLFKTSKARAGATGRNHLLRDVARATSAAPTYFEPMLLDGERWEGERERRALVDGGVFANNPCMLALSEALYSGTAMNEIVLCSVGTGMSDRKIAYEEAKEWGPLGWARPVISVMMDGMSDSANYHARQLMADAGDGAAGQQFFRFDVRLKHALDDLDAAHNANIDALLREADRIMETQSAELDLLAETLMEPNNR